MTTRDFIREEKRDWYLKAATMDRDEFPSCGNLSGAFFYRLIRNPTDRLKPEFVFIKEIDREERNLEIDGFIGTWNMAWEAGHLRPQMLKKKIPEDLKWLNRHTDSNIYLLPYFKGNNYYAHQHLLNLLPAKTREKFGLPIHGKGIWPSEMYHWYLDKMIPKDFDHRLSNAFAYHIWPLLNNSSRLNRFSSSEPISLLAHNLNYWSPFLNIIIENRLLETETVDFESEKEIREAAKANKHMPEGIKVSKPRYGSFAWYGEDEAWEITQELVEMANERGKLSIILDAVKSHRITDDFSELWSYEKEDFERKMFRKRSKVKISFVEVDNAIPVHGPSSEIHDKLIWEDFFTLLNKKERQIVVCLKNGVTKLKEVSDHLGYANHSPVSKAMAAIRKKAMILLE